MVIVSLVLNFVCFVVAIFHLAHADLESVFHIRIWKSFLKYE